MSGEKVNREQRRQGEKVLRLRQWKRKPRPKRKKRRK